MNRKGLICRKKNKKTTTQQKVSVQVTVTINIYSTEKGGVLVL